MWSPTELIQWVLSLNEHFKSLWLQSEVSTGAIKISSFHTYQLYFPWYVQSICRNKWEDVFPIRAWTLNSKSSSGFSCSPQTVILVLISTWCREQFKWNILIEENSEEVCNHHYRNVALQQHLRRETAVEKSGWRWVKPNQSMKKTVWCCTPWPLKWLKIQCFYGLSWKTVMSVKSWLQIQVAQPIQRLNLF